MKTRWRFAAFLAGLILALATGCPGGGYAPSSAKPAPAYRVIVISIDGLRPDALLAAEAPNLTSLWQNGAYSWRAQTVWPSVTLPAHASMLTGVGVLKHGVVNNDWAQKKQYLELPSIFSEAKSAGLKTAMFIAYDPMQYLVPPETVDTRDIRGGTARDIVNRAIPAIIRNKPQLIFFHFLETDSAGHTYGWMSPQQLAVVAEIDKAIGVLLKALEQEGLLSQALILVTSDHGGHDTGHGSLDRLDMTIPWIAWGWGIKKGLALQSEIRTFDTAATVLYALGLPIPSSWDGRPITEAFTQ